MSIYLNDKLIQPTIFPDKTSQVFKLDPIELSPPSIRWEFSHEGEIMHLLQLNDLLKNLGIKSHLYMPYLPYARQDKQISNHTTFAKVTFLKLLMNADFLSITAFDVHSKNKHDGITNVEPKKEIEDTIKHCNPDFICFPDESAFERYYKLIPKEILKKSNDRILVGHKKRDQLTGQILQLEVKMHQIYYSLFEEKNILLDESDSKLKRVKNKSVLMIDDLGDGLGTFVLTSKKLKELGCGDITLYVSHGIFSKGLKEAKESGIKEFYTRLGQVTELDGNICYKEWSKLNV